jgi:Conjugative transposon protein TcpC
MRTSAPSRGHLAGLDVLLDPQDAGHFRPAPSEDAKQMSDQLKSTRTLTRFARRMRLPGQPARAESRGGHAVSAPTPAAEAYDDRRRGGRTIGAAVRAAGRVALWGLIALVLVRGLGDVLAAPRTGAVASADEQESGFASEQARALAVTFARVYISRPTAGALAPYLARGLTEQLRRSPETSGERVLQATVAGVEPLGSDQALVSVACELAGAGNRVLYLAVPLAHDPSGSLSVSGLPSFVPAPPMGQAPAEEAQRLAGPGSAQIRRLAQRFLAAYLSRGRAGELSYLVAPGARLPLLGLRLRLIGVAGVGQAASGPEPGRQTVLVRARVQEASSSATYPVAYRLELVRRDRWYVAAVEGARR